MAGVRQENHLATSKRPELPYIYIDLMMRQVKRQSPELRSRKSGLDKSWILGTKSASGPSARGTGRVRFPKILYFVLVLKSGNKDEMAEDRRDPA